MHTLTEQQPGCGPPAPVPILQWEREFETLLEIYRRSSPAKVLEIGTYHGGTLYHWLQNAAPNTHIVSVDSYVTGVDNRHLYDEWTPPLVGLHIVEGDTNKPSTAKRVQEYGPFDWLFIDAGHYLPEVTADWDLYSPMVAEHGVVILHDILTHASWPSIEVGKLWDRIRQEHLTFEIVQDRDAEWGGLGVVLL